MNKISKDSFNYMCNYLDDNSYIKIKLLSNEYNNFTKSNKKMEINKEMKIKINKIYNKINKINKFNNDKTTTFKLVRELITEILNYLVNNNLKVLNHLFYIKLWDTFYHLYALLGMGTIIKYDYIRIFNEIINDKKYENSKIQIELVNKFINHVYNHSHNIN